MNKHHIPKCIWCFWDSKDLPDTVKLSLDTWKHFNPDYKITVINKKNIKKLIPNINFDKINIAKDSIQKYSDFIRICILRKYGGIWIDGSSFSTCSFDEWFHKIGIKKTTDFIGYVNPQFNKVKYEKKYPMIENWFFACPKNSKFVKEWHKEFMKLKNLDDVNDYIDEVVEEGIDMQWIDNPQYLTQHLAAQVILQRGYNMKNMILLNAIQNKYGNGPLHYFISDKAWTLTDVESVRTLCKDKKEWSQPIVKLVGDTRRIVENNKGIKKCVFKIIEDLLKDKKDLGNKRTKKIKRTKRTKRNKKRTIKRKKRTIGKRKQSGGEGKFILRIGNEKSQDKYADILDAGDEKLKDLNQIVFTIEEEKRGVLSSVDDAYRGSKATVLAKSSVYKGKGSYGSIAEGTITSLKSSQNTSLIELGGLELERKYAIKLMKAQNDRHDEIRTEFKFMKETYGRNQKLFLRPHLLLQKDENSLAIVMELGGESLYDYLGKGTELFTIRDLKRHIGDLAVAISTIHSMGYIHRDLKPDNILLVDNGQLQLKVIDLGIMAKTNHGDDNPMLCCVPDDLGTILWRQPESIQKRQPVSGKVGRAYDWWSFGLIILQLLGYFGKGKRAQEPVDHWGEMNGLFERLYEHYSKIFKRSNQKRSLTEIASGCAFYGGHPEDRQDREDLVKFAFYFLDPKSRTRPFLHLKDDTMTAKFETREGERAKQLQVLVNNLFPKYGIKTE